MLCEKPLTVDFDAARRTIARIERDGCRAAVNFSLASSPGLSALMQAFGGVERPLGALARIEIELAFAAWPRPWQAAAGPWLSQRTEGGFTREVLSHFVFVLQRVLGPARVLDCAHRPPGRRPRRRDGVAGPARCRRRRGADRWPCRPGGAGRRPQPHALGSGPGDVELREWFSIVEQRRGGGAWRPAGPAGDLRAATQVSQLDQWAELVEGRPHALPGFAEALAVQETIEALLRG